MSVINATLRGDTTPAAIAKAANDPKFVEAMAILQATATEMERLDAEQEQPGAQPPPDSSPSPSPSPTPVPVPTVPPQAGGLRSMIDKYASSGATDDQIIADLVARGYSDEETHMDMLAAVLEARARSGR
jgi:hypothetical protein